MAILYKSMITTSISLLKINIVL